MAKNVMHNLNNSLKSSNKKYIKVIFSILIIIITGLYLYYFSNIKADVQTVQLECIDVCLKAKLVTYESGTKQKLLGTGTVSVSGETVAWSNAFRNQDTQIFIDNLNTDVNTISIVANGKYYQLADLRDPKTSQKGTPFIFLWSGINDLGEIAVIPKAEQIDVVDTNLSGREAIIPTISVTPQANSYNKGQEAIINISSKVLEDTKYLQNNPVVYYQFVSGCGSANNTAETWKALDYAKVQKNQTDYTASIPIPSDLAAGLPTLKYIVKSTSVDGSSTYYPSGGVNSAPVCLGIN